VAVGALLVAGGCVSAVRQSPEDLPIQLRTAAGARAQCGMELNRAVLRAEDLTWSERLFYWWSAQNAARRAIQDEEAWRRRCVERYEQEGFEVVSAAPR
jgi:hypothetical protein